MESREFACASPAMMNLFFHRNFPAAVFTGLRGGFLLLILLLALVSSGDPWLLSPAQLAQLQRHYGKEAVARIEDWQRLLISSADRSEAEKLARVNAFFNRLQFVSDREHWGRDDYWATPVEFLATAGGDCEDFSIAKYFTLRALGVSTEKLRLIYVKATRINQAHMVLGYYATPEAEPEILDNLENRILPASQRNDLIPSYSFNGNSLWRAKMLREGGKKVGKSENIGIWKLLLERIQQIDHGRGSMP